MTEFIPFEYLRLSPEEQRTRASEFYALCRRRRSIREFSTTPVAREILERLVLTAASAPSGANRQPWHFVVVTDTELKKKIRQAAEEEEKESYERRMPQEWLNDLAPLGTDWHKEFLETAPSLIAVFAKSYDLKDGQRHKTYYVKESVGIAAGFLLLAIHNAGLVALTHTPSPMDFLAKLLDRPENERAFLLVPVGYPKEGTMVPAIGRKSLDEISTWL
ncbi:MAG: nitroreductase family protein [Proteobacteria bacterium]|nr:nitroreductase family protein [Pseudomonadota bacterium]